MTEKNMGIKICRVFATISIVLCHLIVKMEFIPYFSAISQLLSVGVPMFIIISGFLYGRKAAEEASHSTGVKHFYFGRFLRVSIPCYIWSVFIFIITIGKEPINTIIVLLNLQGLPWLCDCFGIDGGNYLAHTWFVTIILICYLFTPVLRRIVDRVKIYQLIIALIVCCLLCFVGVHLLLVFLYAFSYYFAYKKKNNKINIKLIFTLFIFAVVIRLIGKYYFDNSVIYDSIISIVTLSVIAFSIIILICYLTKFTLIFSLLKKSKFIEFVDNHSYSIYLIHYSLISLLFYHFNFWIAIFAFFIITPVLAVGLDYLVRILNSKLCSFKSF